MSSNNPNPKYPKNHILRMYNQFPHRAYTDKPGIWGMIEYVSHIASMQYNAVWINPLNLTGSFKHPHPDGKSQVSGSLYAMTDDKAYNPLIFPDMTAEEAESAIKIWTAEVRNRGMFPLFDLVLNHIGRNEHGDSPLHKKLNGLLLNEINERWPDIQNIDYYQAYDLAFKQDVPLKLYTVYIDKIDDRIISYTVKTSASLTIDTIDTKQLEKIQGPLTEELITHHFQDILLLIRPDGLKTRPEDLDMAKIQNVFEILWIPLIEHYIFDLGFMGARVDALTHVPLFVLQKANHLIDLAVEKKFGTKAIKVGELMVGNPGAYADALSLSGLTHSLHPCSFYWGHNNEGGYTNNGAFARQNRELTRVVLENPELPNPCANLVISESFDSKYLRLANKAFLYQDEFEQFVLRIHGNEAHTLWSPIIIPLDKLDEGSNIQLAVQHFILNSKEVVNGYKELAHLKKELASLSPDSGKKEEQISKRNKKKKGGKKQEPTIEEMQSLPQLTEDEAKKIRFLKTKIDELSTTLKKLQESTAKDKVLIKNSLNKPSNMKIITSAIPHQANLGGLIGVVGNHDVGTLKAKIMLDLAYSRALSKNSSKENKERLDHIYANFKNIIKGIVNTSDLMEKLQQNFGLTELDKTHLYLELSFRMREKIFIQALSCTGGWYSLAGDELALCHKPEVFAEFGKNDFRVGSPLTTRIKHQVPHDFRAFIAGINELLSNLPTPGFNDTTMLHNLVLTNEIFGSQPAEFLFVVDRYSAAENKHYLLCQAPENLSVKLLLEKLDLIFGDKEWYRTASIHVLDPNGGLQQIQMKTAIDELLEVPVINDKSKLARNHSGNHSFALFKPVKEQLPLVEITKKESPETDTTLSHSGTLLDKYS